MRDLAVTAVGADRPGIVAELTGALLGLGANLDDCRAALLHGSFAIVMAVRVPDEVTVADAEAALAGPAAALGMRIMVGEAQIPADDAPESARCFVSVYGADHPGIVSAVTRRLAELHVNIVDLSSRVVGDPPIYVLGVEAELPDGLDVAALQERLRPVATTEQVELTVTDAADEVL